MWLPRASVAREKIGKDWAEESVKDTSISVEKLRESSVAETWR